MANWVTKYRMEFSDIHLYMPANWRIDILYDGYSGDIKELIGGSDPLIITHGENTNDRTKNILGSSVQLNIVIKDDTFDVSDFFNVEAQQIKINIYRNEKLYWSGFLITDFIEYPRTSAPFEFTIHATDGIADLKSKSGYFKFLIYTEGQSGPLDNEGYQFINVIDFFTKWGVWYNMENVTKTILKSSVSTSKIRNETIYNQILDESAVTLDFWVDEDDETKYRNLYECLEIICSSFGLRMFVEDGNLWLQQISEMGYNYNTIGIYSENENNPNIVDKQMGTEGYKVMLGTDISSTSAIYSNNDTIINIYPPLLQTSIDIDYIPRNWLRNARWIYYQEGTINNTFDHWKGYVKNGQSIYDGVERGGSGTEYDPYYARLKNQDPSYRRALYQDIPINENWDYGITIDLSFKINLTAAFFNYELFVLDENQNEIGYLGSAKAGGLFGNLHTPRQWVFHEIYGSDWNPHSEDSFFHNPKSFADNNGFINISLSTKNNIWDSTPLTNKPKYFRLYLWNNDGGHIDVYPIDFNIYLGVKKKGEIDKFVSKKKYIKEKEINNAKLITATEFEANSIYLKKEDNPLGIPVIGSKNFSYYNNMTIQYLNVATLEALQCVPYQVMKGTFFSNELKFHHVIQRVGDFKLFMQMYDEYHVKMCQHKMTMSETFPYDMFNENIPPNEAEKDPFNIGHFYNAKWVVKKYKTE